MSKRLIRFSLALIAVLSMAFQLNASAPVAMMANGEDAGAAGASYSQEDTVRFFFSEMGLENQMEVNFFEQEGVSVVFDRGKSTTTPKFYTSGSAIRAYGGNTITVSVSENAGIIKGVIFGFGASDGKNNILSPDGSVVSKAVNCSTTSYTFTIDGTSGNRRIASMLVVRSMDNNGGTSGDNGDAAWNQLNSMVDELATLYSQYNREMNNEGASYPTILREYTTALSSAYSSVSTIQSNMKSDYSAGSLAQKVNTYKSQIENVKTQMGNVMQDFRSALKEAQAGDDANIDITELQSLVQELLAQAIAERDSLRKNYPNVWTKYYEGVDSVCMFIDMLQSDINTISNKSQLDRAYEDYSYYKQQLEAKLNQVAEAEKKVTSRDQAAEDAALAELTTAINEARTLYDEVYRLAMFNFSPFDDRLRNLPQYKTKIDEVEMRISSYYQDYALAQNKAAFSTEIAGIKNYLQTMKEQIEKELEEPDTVDASQIIELASALLSDANEQRDSAYVYYPHVAEKYISKLREIASTADLINERALSVKTQDELDALTASYNNVKSSFDSLIAEIAAAEKKAQLGGGDGTKMLELVENLMYDIREENDSIYGRYSHVAEKYAGSLQELATEARMLYEEAQKMQTQAQLDSVSANYNSLKNRFDNLKAEMAEAEKKAQEGEEGTVDANQDAFDTLNLMLEAVRTKYGNCWKEVTTDAQDYPEVMDNYCAQLDDANDTAMRLASDIKSELSRKTLAGNMAMYKGLIQDVDKLIDRIMINFRNDLAKAKEENAIDISEIKSMVVSLMSEAYSVRDSLANNYPNVWEDYYTEIDTLCKKIDNLYESVKNIKNEMDLDDAYWYHSIYSDELGALLNEMEEAESMSGEINKEAEDDAYAALDAELIGVRSLYNEVRKKAMAAATSSADSRLQRLEQYSRKITDVESRMNTYYSNNELAANKDNLMREIEMIKVNIQRIEDELIKAEEDAEKQMALMYYNKLDEVLKNAEAHYSSQVKAIMSAGYTTQTIVDMQYYMKRYSTLLRELRENITKAYENRTLNSTDAMNEWVAQIDYVVNEINYLTGDAERMDKRNAGYAKMDALRSEFNAAVEGIVARRDKVGELVEPYLSLVPALGDTYEGVIAEVNAELQAQRNKVDAALDGMYKQMFGDPTGASSAPVKDDTDYEAIVRECISNLSATNALIDRNIASISLAVAAAKKALETGDIMTLINIASNITHMSVPEITAIAMKAGATGDFSGFTDTAKAYLTKGGAVVAESISMGMSGLDDVTLVFRPTDAGSSKVRGFRAKEVANDLEIVFVPNSLLVNDEPLNAQTVAPETNIDVDEMTAISDADVHVVAEVVNSPEAAVTSAEMYVESRSAEREALELAQAERELAENTQKGYDDFIKEYNVVESAYNAAYSALMSSTFETEVQSEFQPQLVAIYSDMAQNASDALTDYNAKNVSGLAADKASLAGYIDAINKILDDALAVEKDVEDAIRNIATDIQAQNGKDGKFMEDGKIVIRVNGRAYDVTGKLK